MTSNACSFKKWNDKESREIDKQSENIWWTNFK